MKDHDHETKRGLHTAGILLSVNRLDYLKQSQNDSYDDNDNIDHMKPPPFPLVSWIGVPTLWHSMALWFSDSQHGITSIKKTSVCRRFNLSQCLTSR